MKRKPRLDGRIYGRPVCSWRKVDQIASIKEGWILTNDGDDNIIIAKIDDPPSWGDSGWTVPYIRPKFKSDDAAHAFVCRQALKGKLHAIKALAMVGYAD